MKRQRSKSENVSDALLFIDTNIFLNFYRSSDSGLGLKFLEQIEVCKDRLILSSQLEMEYKTNRQGAVLKGLGSFGKPDWSRLKSPAITSETKAAQLIDRHKKSIEEQQKKVAAKIQGVLEEPAKHDRIYQVLQRVFKHRSPYNLDREDERRFDIRALAEKRFKLGYPPRKPGDTSIGDAIHWEWIIHCACESGKDIVIVTRDNDFGREYGGKGFLNDWLRQEFRQRVSQKRKISLTPRLSDGLQVIHAQVTAEMREEEERSLRVLETEDSEPTNDFGPSTNFPDVERTPLS